MLYVFGLVFWVLPLDNVRLNYAKINTKNINKGSAKQSKKKKRFELLKYYVLFELWRLCCGVIFLPYTTAEASSSPFTTFSLALNVPRRFVW